jgi:hypothetical protein
MSSGAALAGRAGLAGRAAALAVLVFAILIIAPASAPAYEHQRNTPSVGGQLHIGVLERDSEWGELFGWGRGGAIRVRQYISRDRAIGLSFELQKFQRATGHPKNDPEFNEDFFQAQILMVDYFFYFQRPKKRCEYVVASAGFYRPELVDEEKTEAGGNAMQVIHPTEGLLARLGVGAEYFLARTFSIDASVSGYYISAPSQDGLTASLQFALGVHLYASR